MIQARGVCAAFAIAFSLLVSWVQPACAEAVPVAGTRVSLEPPPGFIAAEEFPGFQNAENSSSIMVNEIPGPVSQVGAGLTREGLASHGMTLLESQRTKVAGRDGLLVHASQAAAGMQFEKWMVLFGDDAQSVMVTAVFPLDSAESLSGAMKRAVLSTRWNSAAKVDHFDGLPFRIDETKVLKIANRMSNMLLLTEGGEKVVANPSDPLLVVGVSIGDIDLSDLETFARDRIAQIEQITAVAQLQGRTTTVDQLPAYELTAQARDKKSGAPLSVYQLVVADQRRYFLVQGLVGDSRAPDFVPQFRLVGNSLARAK